MRKHDIEAYRNAVAMAMNVPVAELISPNRKRHLVWIRTAMAVVAVQELGMHHAEAGELINRERTSVMHMIRVAKIDQDEPKFQAIFDTVYSAMRTIHPGMGKRFYMIAHQHAQMKNLVAKDNFALFITDVIANYEKETGEAILILPTGDTTEDGGHLKYRKVVVRTALTGGGNEPH